MRWRRLNSSLTVAGGITVAAALLIAGIHEPAEASSTSKAPPAALAARDMLFEFDDPNVDHDLGCGGTGTCLLMTTPAAVTGTAATTYG